MKTSVVIVNYNGGESAAKNAAAVSELAGAEGMELVVVDNCSTDGSDRAIEAASTGARVVREPSNRGYAAAVNRGLEESSGDVVVVLNADVVPEPGALGRLASAAGRYAIVGGTVVDAGGSPSPNSARELPRLSDILREGFFLAPRRPALEAAGTDGAVPVPVISGAAMAVSRTALDRMGPMDEDFFLYREDVEWCRRARSHGLEVGLATDARFVHEGGASTRTNEGPPFAARVLSDFHYYCDVEGAPESAVRRRWLARLAFRSFVYWADSVFGVLGRRPESRARSATYRILYENLRRFSWSAREDLPADADPDGRSAASAGGQKCHPSRLASFPERPPRDEADGRPTVLFVVPDLDYGGVQRRVEFVSGGPLSARYRFEALCLRRSGPIGERIRDRLPIHEIGVERWTSPSTWRRVRDYCALLEPDLVHSGTLPADFGAFVGFGRRVPRIAAKVSVDLWMNPALKLLDRLALQGVRRVYCVSDAVARAKSHLGRDGMLPAVIPNPPMIPIDDGHTAPFPSGAPVRVVCIGRLAAVKRFDVFLRVARAVEERAPGRFSFRLFGDGREREALERLAVELGVTDLVEFAGAARDVPATMAEADIVPMFSSGEGGPMAVLETIARGRVPVVLRAGGAADALPPELDVCYVERLDVDEYVEKIMDIAARSGHYLDLVERAKGALRAHVRYHDAMLDGFYGEAMGKEDGRGRAKVLHLITRLIVGGAQENTIASVARVDPERFESHLWIGPQTGSEGSLLADARSRGLVVRILPNLVREINPLRDLSVLFQLTRLMRRERFDIVHTHSSKAGIVGRIAAKLAGVPHVTHTVHGWGFHEHMNPALRSFYVTLEKVMLPWTRPLVSVSERTTRVGLESGIGDASSYRLIRSGIPVSVFHPDPESRARVREALGVSPDEFVVGSVGRLSAQKNPMDFVRVARSLTAAGGSRLISGGDGGGVDGGDREGGRLRFLYVGDGPLRAEVERELAATGLSGRVELLGLRSDVPELLRAFDVFILTSLWEGLPRVVLQSLATGVPVVAYDTAGIREAVHEGVNGHTVEPGDVHGMVAHLSRMLSDGELRERMGLASRELPASFTEGGMIEDLEALYDELLGRRTRGPSA